MISEEQIAHQRFYETLQAKKQKEEGKQSEVSLRTLYLKSYPSINGRNSLKGRKLYDRLKEISEDCLMGYMVLSDEEAAEFSHPHIRNDILPYTLVKRLDPNLIYIEGGFSMLEGFFEVNGALLAQ